MSTLPLLHHSLIKLDTGHPRKMCVCVCVCVCLPRSPRELLKKKTKKRSNPTLGRHTEKKNPLQFFFLPSSVLPHHRRTSDVKIYILIIPSTGWWWRRGWSPSERGGKKKKESQEGGQKSKWERRESVEESGFSRGQCKATHRESWADCSLQQHTPSLISDAAYCQRRLYAPSVASVKWPKHHRHGRKRGESVGRPSQRDGCWCEGNRETNKS